MHDRLRRDGVDQAGLSSLLQRAGVGADTTVVLYGGNNNWFAAYAYWLCRYLGFDSVKLLNGGRMRWELDGRELTTEVPTFAPTDLAVTGMVRGELRALREEVLAKLGQEQFVDVRSAEEYRGERLAPEHLPQEQAQVPGHIPGAVHVPWSKAANQDGTFRDADELHALYDDAGIDPGSRCHRLLPHRRAIRPHLVRPPRAARVPLGGELRRFLDRIRLPRRRRRRTLTNPSDHRQADSTQTCRHRQRDRVGTGQGQPRDATHGLGNEDGVTADAGKSPTSKRYSRAPPIGSTT